MIEMTLVGIEQEDSEGAPVLLLREDSGQRHLPIWIGQPEASSIAVHRQGIVPARPLTHDLMLSMLTAFGKAMSAVNIVKIVEGTYYAEIVFDDGATLSSRPSDAIALAVRAEVGIYADESVLAEAGITVSEASPSEEGEILGDDEVEQFKVFLDSVSPDDFKAPEGP